MSVPANVGGTARDSSRNRHSLAASPYPDRMPESELVDVTLLSLTDQEAWKDGAVVESINRIIDDLARSAESISGWSSYLPDESGQQT